MDMNVMRLARPLRYYLRNPFILFRDVRLMVRNVKMRIKRGWCPSDAWEWHYWFGTVAPEMFRYLAEHGMTYPGNDEFDTPEKWHDWLNSVADVIEYASNEEDDENEYRKLFSQAMNSVGVSTLDKMEIKDKYIEREEEIAFNRQLSIEDAMSQIGKNYFQLWD